MTVHIKIDSVDDKDYLALPTKELLEEYGKGSHVPGSGSAAALSTLLAIEMMKTVCKITLKKPNYKNIHKYLEPFLTELETRFKPQLLELFKKDIEVFHRVIFYKNRKNKEPDEIKRKEYWIKELDKLKEATEIPMQICQICLELLESAVAIFDRGYNKVRGDSGVAISSLLSAASGSLFIILLNLNSFPESQWLIDTRVKAEELTKRLNSFQAIGFEKVLELYEALKNSDKEFKFELFSED